MIIRTNEDQTADERVEFIAEAIETDKDEQFEEMDYTVECNICGRRIIQYLLSNDFNRPGLIKGPEGIQDAMEAHNMTHYVKPTVRDCQEDDIFEYTHDNCIH